MKTITERLAIPRAELDAMRAAVNAPIPMINFKVGAFTRTIRGVAGVLCCMTASHIAIRGEEPAFLAIIAGFIGVLSLIDCITGRP